MTTKIILLLLSICILPLLLTISAHRPPFIRLPTEKQFVREYPSLLDIDDYPSVNDSNGNPVRGGHIYYAKVVILGAQGGISVANFDDPTRCPTDVFLNLSILTPPPPQPPAILRPIIFHPFDNPTGQVQEFVPTYVDFYETNPIDPCPLKWKLDQDNIVAAYESSSTFSIEATGLPNSYIFVGIGVVDELRRLGIANTPSVFQFVKFQ